MTFDLPGNVDGEAEAMDADELMMIGDRIERLPSDDAVWANRLFAECMRARLHEAELLSGAVDTGAAATTSEDQLAQVALDTAEWLRTLWNVGYMGAGSFPSQPRSAFPLVGLEDVLKSALFARIRQGKRPLPFPPPTRNGLPWHEIVESEQSVQHAVEAEVVRDSQGSVIGAVIEGCADWHIVEMVAKDCEYVIQHRGKGPFYRLKITPFLSTLQREAPRWVRRLSRQERAGFASYVLEWLDDTGATSAVPLRAASWERAESEAAHWIATHHPAMYGQVSFERVG